VLCCSNIKEYCEVCVNKADVPISGPVADYGCLFYAVNLQGTIALVDKSKEVKLSLTTVGVTNSEDGDEDACFGKVHLLLRQGSYDILYLNDDVYSATTPVGQSPQMGSPPVPNRQQGSLSRQSSNSKMTPGAAPPVSRRPSITPAGAAAGAAAGASPPVSRRPSISGSVAGGLAARPPGNAARAASTAVATPPPAAAQPESISMETMKMRFEALGVIVTDMNVIFEICQHCKTVEQGIAYYYREIVPRSATSPASAASAKSTAPTEEPEQEYEEEQQQEEPAPPPAPKVPTRVNSGMSSAGSSGKGPTRINSGVSVDESSATDTISPMNRSVNTATSADDPLAGNEDYIHRQFLPLLKMGFDIDQILEAIDVGQCATFDIALGYLRRKMKYTQERGGVASKAPVPAAAIAGKPAVKSNMNMTFSDLRVESELESPMTDAPTQPPAAAPAAAAPAPTVAAAAPAPIAVGAKKSSMWGKLKAAAPPTPDPVPEEEPEEPEPVAEPPRAPARGAKTAGAAKLQGLLNKGALTGKVPAKSGGLSLSSVKSMVAKMKAQAALEEEQAQGGDEHYDEDDPEEANERINHMPDTLSRNTVTVNTVVPRGPGRGAPSGMGNYAAPMNNSMYQQPAPQPMMNASMYQQPMGQPMMSASMYQQPMAAPMPRPIPVHGMGNQVMGGMSSSMYQQPVPRAPAPRPARGPPRPQVPAASIANFSEEQRIIYQKLLNMQQPQAEAMRLAAKFTSIDEFCDYMEKQRAPAPQVQVQAQQGAGAKKGWGALKMFKK
jgi:hypothetical protein